MRADLTPGTVTVFGGTGFIGRYVVQKLARAGWTVRVAVRRPDEALFLKPAGEVGQIAPLACNVRDADSVRAALSGAHAAVNLVGILFPRGRQRFDVIHAEVPGLIGRIARESGLENVVHVSALGADAGSASHYARSKAAGEENLRQAFPAATIVRPSVVFGPEDDFFNRFARLARFAPALPLIGGGGTRMQPVYVGDVASAIAQSVTKTDHRGQTYELGGPRIYSLRDIMMLVMAETGRHRPLIPVPFALASILGGFLSLLPRPPLTRDQVLLLKTDNIVSPGARDLSQFGITPKPAELIVPDYLSIYRRGGLMPPR